jgi:hypothetical protein
MEHEPGIGAGDQDRQVTVRGTSAVLTFIHLKSSPNENRKGWG